MFKVILVGALLAFAAVLSPAPAAQADVCGDVGGRHVSVGGCTDPAARVAVAADDEAAAQAAAGQPPCYTVEGVPYYTPDGDPC
ncbi:hypothetical protein A5791_02155 [Mycobacterium sp. 852002-51163_SCH5372311]|uniref:hypothetical protein n=1 Tax=Mycobacterium sp. 852002-51163_SCH5372311 TaxID=1834097 RepID=UPI0007FBCA0F|nr:hypothetical protein [Mycobacterium sp. 852002-51163_SCH5372311]OBF85391.1 hypothetical protein A5791_02155 [Mycobacterium sp. 852002-51163_SCH5372311]